MLQKNNREKILEIFFEDPLPKGIGFQLREIARKTKIAPPSTKRYLLELEKENLIKKEKHRIYGYPTYYANRENEYFKLLKKQNIVKKLQGTGFSDYIQEKCLPKVIILFGSTARGEDIKESDIDIFIESKEKKLEVEKYEKICGRRISLFFSENFEKSSKELKNNIINGIILKGYLKVF